MLTLIVIIYYFGQCLASGKAGKDGKASDFFISDISDFKNRQKSYLSCVCLAILTTIFGTDIQQFLKSFTF